MDKTKDFHLKQFSIIGGHSGMPVSTDGILLGAWANLLHAHSILDIGTGTGLLALMSAQRNPKAKIQAIDIDIDAVDAATINIKNSPWSDRITVEQDDITQRQPNMNVEHITCNPPYFNSGETTQSQARAKARHTLTLSHPELLIACRAWLSDEGEASFILPKAEGKAFLDLAQTLGWFISRICEVNTTATKPCHRMLIALTRRDIDIEYSQLTIHENGQYSRDFIELTKDFYLKM
ncbi:tRNA1(Val) (adenine(37)-N6)-methyltransferase [Vibrio rumoiensis]|uniref:tRNA1(Val) (adenine(37)-N6)-methyltransferase n=1 Tax=Vibrio rumoiensis 1S-45 TaxID=1188252 RepID=A0A1E5DYA7_9VIBR|nr:methyltransferase [Vibrio rumoiensis]OEF22602.1 tRNA (adenosine(37)-N6)-methyltransferase TrmM [Vibrio rumoiensis 1S-45]